MMALDLVWRRVPNRVLLPAILVCTLQLVLVGHGENGNSIGNSLLGAACGFVLLMPFYLYGLMAAGDVKFLSVLGFIFGTQALLPLFIAANLLAAIHACLFYCLRYFQFQLPQWIQVITYSSPYQKLILKRNGKSGIPYAAYLALAALVFITR